VDDLVLAGTDVAAAIVFEMIGFTREPGNQFVFPNVAGCLQVSGTEDQPLADWIAVVGNESALILSFARAADLRVSDLHYEWGLLLDGSGECLPDARRSDHAPFWDEGWPALMLTDTANFRNPNYHDPTDTPDTLDFPFARNVAAATAAFLVEEPLPAPEPGAAGLLAVGALVLAGAARARAA